jgi:hypothetical protein
MASDFVKRLPQRLATEKWEPAKRLPITAESAISMAKDRENKKKRLKKAHETDKKEKKTKRRRQKKKGNIPITYGGEGAR